MAGAYPDYPSQRMAYDADGTVVLISNGADNGLVSVSDPPQTFPYVEATQTEKENLNDEDTGTDVNDAQTLNASILWCLMFPELRDLLGIYYAWSFQTSSTKWTDVSADTTNGADGSWTSLSYTGRELPLQADHRDTIQTISQTAKRSVRYFISDGSASGGRRMRSCHIYGMIAASETPDRILFLDDATGLEFAISGSAPETQDWGDRPRGSILDWDIRLRNNSAVAGNNLTANTVIISAEELTGSSGGWYSFSDDGSSFATTETVTSISPEANSGVLNVRQTLDEADSPGLQTARLKVTVASWT